ncbi:dienelactone hydrolase [Caulobacter segnis]|uniref:Dienelactone hydrolase-like protein n=2 Tax=Caulobacter segnis TaxID=88688 RepID=D5VDI4_CAUST|nr:dienelactone hydrolase [Caulobacter segnis]ADG10802.1 dienelactone hydrolase-like protein [Caulobacter segnis ATCC 21756]AVQ02506.1 dienelactone hydrolase [Caulobacter segnis]
MKFPIGWLLCLLLASPSASLAQEALSDAPALAAPGAYPVGVLTQTLIQKDQPDLVASDLAAGKLARGDRSLPLTFWHPAVKPAADAPRARYTMPDKPAAGKPPAEVPYKTGGAYPDAKPVRGQAFPLVVISHGYRNWATSFSDLAENLASKGYVVAAIDHHDLEPVTLAAPQLSFATTVITRVADQRFVIDALTRKGGQGPLRDVYDAENVALIGYSMGGFGALATMGAGLDPNGPLSKSAPAGLLRPFTTDNPTFAAGAPQNVKAMVAFAPWGGAPPLRAWTAESLAKITVPSLLIVGDQDDVSGYGDGVAWVYGAMTGADRNLLVYENARHNIARDGTPPSLVGDFQSVVRFEEPVWRRDRILAINRHFITAFLDARLKGDQAHGAYLAVPTVKAVDGVWRPGSDAGSAGAYASPSDTASAGYWPGFQNRWALGLQLRHDTAAAPAAPR